MDKAEQVVQQVCQTMMPRLNEKERRELAGSLAKGYGRGGETIVKKYSGLSFSTVKKGMEECDTATVTATEEESDHQRVRRKGAGRKKLTEKIPELEDFVDSLLQETTYGDPMRVIQYTTLSLRKIASHASEFFHTKISRNVISNILDHLGYSKQQNQKMEQLGKEHPDRNAQFHHINETAKAYIEAGEPVISIDCKKKENIGNFKNNGQEYRHKSDPRHVLDHDFPIPELGKVAPYGIYVLNNNTGFVNLGTSHDTADFAVQSIRSWWYDIGQYTFPHASKLYITADGGGSNSVRSRQFKFGLATLAEETGLTIEVSHYPPGTSKWNKIEHRLFCYITSNWKGKPLINVETVISLIGSTTTTSGLQVTCKLDEHSYPTGVKVSDVRFNAIHLTSLAPNEGWNYVISGFKN